MQGAPVTMFENRFTHKSGRLVPLLWSASWDDNNQLMYCIVKDASEKKRLEKAFEIERERFEELVSEAPSCMGALKGRDHVFVSANHHYLQLIGKQNIIGKTVKEVLPEMAEQGFLDLLNKVYDTGETFTGNEMLVTFDLHENGEKVEKYLTFLYQAHRNEDGDIDGIFFFANDVTEQVISRRKIEQSERRYRQIVETAQEGIWLIDEGNKTTFVNSKMCEILQYSAAEIFGKELFEFMDEEGKNIAADTLNILECGSTKQQQFKFISKGGQVVWTLISTNPLYNDGGGYMGALVMVTDVTERRMIELKLAHSENGLKEAQTIAHLGNWEIDLIGNNHFWSDEMYKILGVKVGAVVPSMESLLNFVPSHDRKNIEQKMQDAVKKRQESVLHFQLNSNNGEVRYVQAKWRFQFDDANNPTHILGIMQDVTSLKLAELERTKMVKDLIQRNKDLEQFNYIVSHNLTCTGSKYYWLCRCNE